MEVREASAKYSRATGYKQTEVGVIPEDWEVSRLGMLGEVIRGASPRPKGDKRFYGGTVPRLMVEDVTRDGKIVVPQVDFLTEEGAKRSRPCRKGTLTIVCSGTVGIPSFLGVDACIHDGFLALVGIHKKISGDYLYHQLCRLRESFDSSATHGGIFTNLTTSGVKEFSVPLPPTKAEQEAIAEALSDADALIESLEHLLAKKRHLKQGAMQQLLTGKKRLPGFSGEWEVKRLGECLSSRPDYGINAAAVSYSDRLPTYIRITDISDYGRFAPDSLVSVAHTDAAHYYLNDGDLVFARTGASVGKSYLYNPLDGQLVFAGFLIRVRPDPAKLIPAFLANFVQTGRYWSWVKLMSMRSGQPGINGNEFAQLPITCPSVAEQTAIATLLSDMDTELAALEAKLAKARHLKQGMMQELLTGRIRLI
jgi:type I restriction enzyme S subunit